METNNTLDLKAEIINALRQVNDPEISVNIYDLGLVYKIDINNADIYIEMTLTAPNCPMAELIFEEVRTKVSEIQGISNVEVNLVFEPQWSFDMMSDEAKLELGML